MRPAVLATLVLLVFLGAPALAADRFPHPEFESGYGLPVEEHPQPRAGAWVVADVAALFAALVLAAVLVLRVRWRGGVWLLMLGSLVYFGFVRQGCICSVGSLQNVALGLFDESYVVPVAALVFFLLPLVAALLFGRVFCAAVCPLGAIQDAVLVRPLPVPRPLAAALGFLPVVYLALALLFAVTGTAFVICRYDPFVSLFRLSGSAEMLLFGGGLLAAGTVVARPYCRFLCPYGVLLGWLSRVSRRHAAITPDRCIQCRLCESVCPVDAILAPVDKPSPSAAARRRRAVLLLLLLLPLLVGGGGLALSSLAPVLSRLNPDVSLARRVWAEDTGEAAEPTDASDAYRATGRPAEDLFSAAGRVEGRFHRAGWVLGGLLGLVLGLRLLATVRKEETSDYEIDRGTCVSCARCFRTCPREQVRRTGKAGEASP